MKTSGMRDVIKKMVFPWVVCGVLWAATFVQAQSSPPYNGDLIGINTSVSITNKTLTNVGTQIPVILRLWNRFVITNTAVGPTAFPRLRMNLNAEEEAWATLDPTTGVEWFTDGGLKTRVTFYYTIREGDMVAKLKIAGADGSDAAGAGYGFDWGTYRLVSNTNSLLDAVWRFASSNVEFPGYDPTHYDFSYRNVAIKTLQFGSTPSPVQVGESVTWSVTTANPVSDGRTVNCYVWVSNSVPTGGNVNLDGVKAKQLTIAAGGTTASFQITGLTAGTNTVYLQGVQDYGNNATKGVLNVETRQIIVTPAPPPYVSVRLQDVADPTFQRVPESASSSAGKLRVRFSQAYTQDMWVRLDTALGTIPQSPQSNNLIFTTSPYYALVLAGQTESSDVTFRAPDGIFSSDLYGVSITPVLTNATGFFTGLPVGCVVAVSNVAPVVTTPKSTDSLTATRGVPFRFTWNVTDVAADVVSGMTITWKFDDASAWVTTNGAAGEIYHTYNDVGAQTVRIRATDKDGAESAEVQFTVTVVEPVPAPSVSLVFDRTPVRYGESLDFNTGWLKIQLSKSFSTEDVQVQLSTAPTGQSNVQLAFTDPVTIARGTTLSEEIPFSLLDGTLASSISGITITPVVINPAASNYYTDLRSSKVYVTNVVPRIVAPVAATDLTLPAVVPFNAVPMGRPFAFDWEIEDVAADASPMVINWDFGDGTTLSVTNGLTGRIYHTYASLGDKVASVRAIDKDGAISALVKFKVTVVTPPPLPTVYVRSPAGVLDETASVGTGSIDVELSEAFTNKVTVLLTVDPVGSLANGSILLATNVVEFRTGEVLKTVKVSARDGTSLSEMSGFVVTPTVLATPAATAHYTELVQGVVYVRNVAPVIRTPTDPTSPTEIAYTIPQGTSWTYYWDIQDVTADLAGMTVTWYFGDGATSVQNGGNGSVPHVYDATGTMTVRMVAQDKDGGRDEVQFKVTIAPAKTVLVTPIGPNYEANYWGASGLGNGMVFSEDALGVINRNNVYFFRYGPGVSSAALRAVPYKTGASGLYTVTNYLNDGTASLGVTNDLDSFFYVWVGENQGLPTQDLIPAQAGPTTAVTLPAAATGTGGTSSSVDIRIIQAIFSREYRKADNMGDINQDGIPDKIATLYNLPTEASGGTGTGTGTGGTGGTPIELLAVGNFNGDKDAAGNVVGDFLPGAASGGGAIIGGISNVFATVGDPFTAFLEVRGFHPGLNNAQYNSDSDFGAGETDRTCERPTNPTLQDTDGDLFPDGWEYYFWYNSKIRGVTGLAYTPTNVAVGTLIPTKTIVTAFDPIVPATDNATGAAVNRDLDNDGLSDIEELSIGTNPIQWDTDFDGICDGWEVLRGLNPNDQRDALSNPDGDYMAYVVVPRNLVTVAGGLQYLVPITYVLETNQPLGLTEQVTGVYRYGGTNAMYAAGRAVRNAAGQLVLSTNRVDALLLHNQVYQEYGFDPRTAWAMTVNTMDNPQRFPDWVAGLTTAYVLTAPNTKAYTAMDEYLLLKYMSELRLNGATESMGAGTAQQKTADWTGFSTHPKTPDSDVEWGAGGAVTKSDAMPDGWELYVAMPPRYTGANMLISPWNAYDGEVTFTGEDDLANEREFHGTDCSPRYNNVALYGAEYPVVTILRPAADAGWINKFWPSNPFSGDTDGDGLADHVESTAFAYGGTTLADNGTTCTPGGGLNPCAIDTDSDQLPDAFENAFTFTATPVTPGASTNGMNGTVSDWNQDWDHDGLPNYQEYWVQAVRSLRYDFTTNQIPMDGSVAASAFFVEVTNAWDFCRYPWGTGNPPLRVLLPVGPARKYVSTDPRDPDTDGDGMDDFYEMFHALNPILGDTTLLKGDRIKEAYLQNGMYTIDYGSLVLGNGWGLGLPFDFVTYPWLAGMDEADPDADGLRNMEEQLQADSAAPSASNTDPSPLWMTDDSSFESVTARFYRFDFMFFWPGDAGTLMTMYQIGYKMFSYEMNEGYDTDNDGLCDKSELLQTATSQSDPRDHDDPRRRQALWFSGSESAAQTMYTQPEGEWAFRSFTVELWARPETVTSQEGQVLIERPVIYGTSDLSTPYYMTRLNFRIGIAPDGRVYAMYQNAGAHDAHTGEVIAYGRVLTPNEWVRIVARMDAQAGTFQLFLDQEPPITVGTALIPANGVLNVVADPDSGQYPAPYFISITPAVLVLGAANYNADPTVTFPPWNFYGQYFQGYLDEVRVWDGARTPEEIRADYAKRYTKDELLANRRAVAESQYAGGTRVAGATPQLPPALIYHYTFDNLFGADRAESVAKVPRGFNYPEVTVNRPWGYVVGWWEDIMVVPTHSTVYNDYGYIPWIENGVDHLPIFGGRVQDGTNVVVRDANTVRDSVYWSLYSAGVLPTPASAHVTNGISIYSFPNENDPYGYWYKHSLDLVTTEGAGIKIVADLLPLGGAWAKQAQAMWDNDAPASVWADQAVDDDADGLADWWEADVSTNYFSAAVGWYDLSSNGMTAGELYMRDLAKGYTEENHPGSAGYNPNTLVKQTSDIDGDGLPDWWENLFNLSPTLATGIDGAMGDPDRDGLSNYAEYLISDEYSLRVSRPDRYRTSATQTESDYFVKAGLLYYGEMFSDHDFMEDTWEDNYDAYYVNRYVYDPHMDWDQDGWANWSECRYGASALRSDPTLGMHLNPEQDSVKDFPVPVIETRLSYNGIRPIGNLILFAYSDPGMDGAPDAVWRVQTSSGAAVTSTKNLGYWGAKTIKGFLSPGTLVPGTVQIEMVDTTDNPSLYSVYAGYDIGNASGMSGVIYGQSGAGLSSAIGTINYITGEYEIDLSWFKGMTLARMVSPTLVITAVPDNSYVKITYQSSQVVGWPKTLYLSDAEVPTATLPSRGYVSEGINHFFAMLDLNNNGVWDAGEPCGVSDTFGVDIGYDRNVVNIELTDYTPGFLRMTFIPPQRSEDIFTGGAVQQAGGGATALAGLEKRIVVKRSAIDGNKAYQDIVLEKTLSSTRAFVHEGDLLAQGDLSLDWGLPDVPTAMDRLTAVYEVFLGNDTVLTNAVLSFTNRFDNVRAKAQSVFPVGNGYVYSARPTFKWSMPKNYSAFTLEIRKFSATGPVIYNSGAVKAPARDVDGNCVWTAPVYAGMRAANGQIYASNTRYAWRVSALDAKFSDATVSPNWSDWQVYRLDVNPPLDSAGYGAIKAVVKYHGPATAMLANRVKVQVFHNAAFTGLPEAELTLAGTGLTVLTDPASTLTNAVVCGLAPSVEAGDYYVRAYIDHNDNGIRDVWESWGYACSYGVNDTPYDPFPVKVKYVPLAQCETVVIHIEDADSDQDWFPDAWEFEQNPTDEDFLALSGPGDPSNGDPDYEMTNPNLLPAVNVAAPSLFTALALGTTDADQDGLGDLAELVLGSNAQSASTAGDGLTDGTKLGLGLVPADTLAVDVTGLSLSGAEASVQWAMAVQKAEGASRALLSTLAPATGTVRYEVLFTPSLQSPDWQVVASDVVTLESGTEGLSTRIARTQQALQAATAQGFFRIRLVE